MGLFSPITIMHPLIIGIAGAHSGAGKTTVACEILKRFKGWGAIKYTKTSLYSSITGDPQILLEEGKDTRKMTDAGAEQVLWVQAPSDEIEKVIPQAVDMLSHLAGVIIEGNTAVNSLKCDIVLFVSGSPELFKNNAERFLYAADIILSDMEFLQGIPPAKRQYRKSDIEGYMHCLERIIEEKRANR
jgi:molybdopterin-guanine dinucleotide biosynthesis protein